MATFFYLGNGKILGVEVNQYGNVSEEWQLHESYEMEMAGRSCVTEGEDNHHDLSRGLRYTYSTAEWVGRPVTDLESRSRLERELEEDVWYIDRDPEFAPMAKQCPRWAAKRSGEPFYGTLAEAINAMFKR